MALEELLADVHCRVPMPVHKRAKAEWKKVAPPALYELVKKRLRSLKQLDHEVLEQLEALELAISEAGLDFDVVAFARAIFERSGVGGSPEGVGASYLFPRDATFAREYLPKLVDPANRRLALDRLTLRELPDTLYAALPALRAAHAIERLDVTVDALSSRVGELVHGIRVIDLSTEATTLPSELFHADLHELKLHARKLTSLPEEIGDATSLRSVILTTPRVHSLPASLSTLPLQTFALDAAVAELDISAWPALRQLSVAGGVRRVTGVEVLRDLAVYDQRCHAAFPDAVWELPKLERVGITFAGLDDVKAARARFEARGVRVD